MKEMKTLIVIVAALARCTVLTLVLSTTSTATLAETSSQRTIGSPVGPTDQETTSWRFPASTVRMLKLTNSSGDMLLRRSEGTEIRVKAVKHNASRRDLNDVLIDLQQQDDRLIGRARYLAAVSSVAVSFFVEVPSGISIELRSSSGNITLDNIDNEVHAVTGSGDIQVAYTQPLQQIEPQMGLTESHKRHHVIRNGGGGNIIVQSEGGDAQGSASRTLTTGSGSITLRLSDQVRADVLVESPSPAFQSDFPEVEELSVGRFLGRVNGGGPLIVLSTGSGKITVNRI